MIVFRTTGVMQNKLTLTNTTMLDGEFAASQGSGSAAFLITGGGSLFVNAAANGHDMPTFIDNARLVVAGAMPSNSLAITTQNGGTLQIGTGGTTGSISSANGINNNGNVVFNRSDSHDVANMIGGSGDVHQNGGGTTVLTGANSYTGVTTINNGTLQIGDGGIDGTLGNGGNVVNDSNLAFNRMDSYTVTNTISGGGAVYQNGSGVITLTANNTYAGTTTVNAGTLRITGTHSGGGAFSVENGATLGGTGNTGAPVTVKGGGTLAPGASIGVLTMASLDLQASSTFEMEVNTTDGAENADKAVVTTGGVSIAPGEPAGTQPTLRFVFTPAVIADYGPLGKTFIVIQKDSAGAVTPGSQFANAPDDTLVVDGLLSYIVDYNYTGAAFNGTGNGNDVAVTFIEVPEPAAAGVGAMAVAAQMLRRRRRSVH
jgi:autotransporter-associated beta strand protein